MRFIADGPSIPDELIVQQREGGTVFLCGAGVSMPTGLPSFWGLTSTIIEELNSDKAREPFEREEYDRAFNALVREFGRDAIDSRLFRQLRAPRNCDVSNHANLLALSRTADGKPQLVTTNFDLLFERAEPGIRYSVPPILPDLNSENSLDGIVYLHGRLTSPQSSKSTNYIVSSSDFGRAYLSEGWGARFVRALREKYSLVLIGYRAEDPPMRYLLEGLNSVPGDRYSQPIYAFTPGEENEAEELWAERGVTPIAYSNEDGKHSDLWLSIGAWAEAARNPEGETKRVIGLAQRKPRTLQAFERGQVCSLVLSKEGANAFSTADPAPHPEWLCVFDPYVRYADAAKAVFGESEEIDPLDVFGVDDDPPRPIKDGVDRPAPPGRDFLAWNKNDESLDDRTHLAAWHPEYSNRLPSRLRSLASWFRRVMDDPATVWWAAGRPNINPNLNWFIERRLADKNEPLAEPARLFWRLFLEQQRHEGAIGHDLRWYQLKELIEAEGWSPAALRFLRRISEPYVALGRYRMREPAPPQADWDKIPLKRIVDLEVRVLDRHGDGLKIPDEKLHLVLPIVRQSLVDTTNLLKEIGETWWSSPNLDPTGARGESFHGRRVAKFLWFKSLFENLISYDSMAAKAEFETWDANDPVFFGKLFIYFARDNSLIDAAAAAERLACLSDRVFWDRDNQRELLFTLRQIWNSLSSRDREKIEKRLTEGRERWRDEDSETFKLRAATQSISRLRWLQLEGLEISKSAITRLRKLQKNADPRWNDDWARAADDSMSSSGGMVERITDTQGLEALPVSKVLEEASAKTKDEWRELQDFRPFEGLVHVDPFKALSSLRRALRSDEFPRRYWENLLTNWPEAAKPRLTILLGVTLARLKQEQAMELRHYIPDWLRKNIAVISRANRKTALNVFDQVLSAYEAAGVEDLKSGIGETTVGGVRKRVSEVSVNKALNSPAGKLCEALFELVPKPRKGRNLAVNLQDRFARLFTLKGDGAGHAAAMTMRRIGWLDYWFPDWVKDTLWPFFSPAHRLSEAVWHGLPYAQNGLSRKTLEHIVPHMVRVVRGDVDWPMDEQVYRHLIRSLVALSRPDVEGGPTVRFAQIRDVLREIDDLGRSEAVSVVSRIVQREDNWDDFGRRFFEQAWPQQLRYRGELSSRAFASLLGESEERFPGVLKTILPLVRPVSHLDMFSYRLRNSSDGFDYAARFPAETLTALDAFIDENRPTVPYELPRVLSAIADADPGLRRNPVWRKLNDLAI